MCLREPLEEKEEIEIIKSKFCIPPSSPGKFVCVAFHILIPHVTFKVDNVQPCYKFQRTEPVSPREDFTRCASCSSTWPSVSSG